MYSLRHALFRLNISKRIHIDGQLAADGKPGTGSGAAGGAGKFLGLTSFVPI
jgi:hypothetical protein